MERSDELRERKKHEVREAIIRVGIELFAERGYEKTRVADVAAAVGISKSTFFEHFRWKEDLLFEESRNTARRLADVLAGRADGELTIDVLERTLSSLRNAQTDPDILRLSRLTYQVLAAEPRRQGYEPVEFAERLRPSIIAAYSSDLSAAGVTRADSGARILTGLTIGSLLEEMNLYRASVVRDLVPEDRLDPAF